MSKSIDLNNIDIYDQELLKQITSTMEPEEKKKFMKSVNNKKYFLKNREQINERYRGQRAIWAKNKRDNDEEFRKKANQASSISHKKRYEMNKVYKEFYLSMKNQEAEE